MESGGLACIAQQLDRRFSATETSVVLQARFVLREEFLVLHCYPLMLLRASSQPKHYSYLAGMQMSVALGFSFVQAIEIVDWEFVEVEQLFAQDSLSSPQSFRGWPQISPSFRHVS
jgi:hypothetical protein